MGGREATKRPSTDAEHLHSLDSSSSSSSIDPEQVEEYYFHKTERSRYGIVYKRKKSKGGKSITADHDKAIEKQSIEEEEHGVKSKEDDKLAD